MQLIWILSIALMFGDSTSGAQKKKHVHLMADPLFGIAYNPQEVKFEEAPALIRRLCLNLRDRKMWIYGHWKTEETEYFILSGFIGVYPDIPGRDNPPQTGIQPDIVGTAVAITGTKCLDDISEYFLRGEVDPNVEPGSSPIAPEAVLNEIAADAMERYARAFGGKQQFLEKLTPEDRKAVAPVVQKQLERFEHPDSNRNVNRKKE